MNNRYYLIHFFDFVSKALRKLKFPKFLCRKYNDLIHSKVNKDLNPYFDQVYFNLNKIHQNTVSNNNVIWIFWWQSLQNAPMIVKKCIQSVKLHANGHPVIIIDKNNIRKYTNIPKYIYQYLNQHKITFTHFSDILRFNLLRNHGGLWVDSTIYCTSDIEHQFHQFYTSGGYSDPYDFFVSSKWTGFLIGGNKNNPLFTFMDEFFKLYWKTHSYLIDYFLIDYALNYAYINNIGNFKKYVDLKAYKNNPHLHSLQGLLNSKYNKELYGKFTNDTKFFKLTYKMRFTDNNNTFYNRLINNK